VGIDDRQEAFGGGRAAFGLGLAPGGAARARGSTCAIVCGRRWPVGPEARGRVDRMSRISDLIGLLSMLSLRLLLAVVF